MRVTPVERLLSVGLVERVAQVKRISPITKVVLVSVAPVTKVVVVRIASIARIAGDGSSGSMSSK